MSASPRGASPRGSPFFARGRVYFARIAKIRDYSQSISVIIVTFIANAILTRSTLIPFARDLGEANILKIKDTKCRVFVLCTTTFKYRIVFAKRLYLEGIKEEACCFPVLSVITIDCISRMFSGKF